MAVRKKKTGQKIAIGTAASQTEKKASSPSLEELPFSKPIPLDRFQSALAGPFKLFVWGVAITIGLMILVSLLPASLVPKPSWSWSVQETPLEKNTHFQLQAGDQLDYEVNTSGQLAHVRLSVSASRGCPGLLLTDAGSANGIYGSLEAAQAADPGVYEVCVGADGNERAADGKILGSNLSFSNVSWPYFQPWMLSLKDGFDWKAARIFTVQPANQSSITALKLKVINHTTYAGREAYAVELTAAPAPGQTAMGQVMAGNEAAGSQGSSNRVDMLIDAKERVLLYTQSGPVTVRLVGAPFLNASTG